MSTSGLTRRAWTTMSASSAASPECVPGPRICSIGWRPQRDSVDVATAATPTAIACGPMGSGQLAQVQGLSDLPGPADAACAAASRRAAHAVRRRGGGARMGRDSSPRCPLRAPEEEERIRGNQEADRTPAVSARLTTSAPAVTRQWPACESSTSEPATASPTELSAARAS